MFNKMKLQTRLFSAFLFIGFIVLIVAAVGWSGNSRLSSHINTLSNNHLPSAMSLWKINEGQTQVQSGERALLNPLLSKENRDAELVQIKNAWEQINQGFKQYELTPQGEEEKKLYKKFFENWKIWKQDHEEFMRNYERFAELGVFAPRAVLLELTVQGKQKSPQIATAQVAMERLTKISNFAANEELNSFKAVTASILDILEYDEVSGLATKVEADQDVTQSTFWVAVGILLGPLTAVLFGMYFTQKIAKPLETQVQQSGIQVTTSATQIAASGKQLEAMIAEQAASTNEVVATAKEIAATSGQLVKTMDEVTLLSETTAKAAGNSQKDLVVMEATMRQLAEATATISSKLGTISAKANNINSVVTTITKVADQTNLLSLNAAIEAEKAGEYGLGFAVVAREIRRLADRTAVATLDIEQMVKEMQSAVATGVMEMDKFTKEVGRGVEDVRNISVQLAEIIEQVQALNPRFEAVNQGMEAQSLGAGQISEAMVQLSESSTQTADSLREINSALSQLNEAAHGLRREVLALK
ncbi:HAMP domain-containing methyl-accepting chemotaxis protein [Microcoleus sp. FACHB-672]|uniref:HAMP domain-containing methyl-accepting chemotaxis protein n=1 Tax=Microcoleus sp. FACHB-672 TaxID=2692825 RepID=UPI001F54B4D7|nr:methyl-accepting chemotaxis protein [Microcoleus sp. FACHB-672]